MSDAPFRDVAGRPEGPLTAETWNARWVDGDTPWDLGGPAPPFVRALHQRLIPPVGRMLVVGCGAGHDARHFAAHGLDVTAIDLAPEAIERARQLTPPGLPAPRWIVADLFAPPPDIGTFDALLEHTCFCAIDPSRRDAYVQSVAELLRPGGLLLGLFFAFEAETGPPFGASEEEIRHRFGARFEVLHCESPRDSHGKRAGIELLFVMRRRA